jgi:hypothetical protein
MDYIVPSAVAVSISGYSTERSAHYRWHHVADYFSNPHICWVGIRIPRRARESKMIFNIIAYRPNGDDYCRGCHMGSSDSQLETFHTEDVSKAAEFVAKKKFEDHINTEREVCNHDFIIILDGRVMHNDIDNNWAPETDSDDENEEYYTVINGMHNSIDTIVAYLLQEKAKEAEAAANKRKAQEDKLKREQKIIKDYATLMADKPK